MESNIEASNWDSLGDRPGALPTSPSSANLSVSMVRRSQVQQSLHYFSRPHTSVRRTPITTDAAWRGDDFDHETWIEPLEVRDLEELENALEAARRSGRDPAEMSRTDFPLPHLAEKIARWQATLRTGRGFVVLRGVPVERWSQSDSELFFWCFGQHLGVPGAQNPQGDLLGHVRATGVQPGRTVRQYRTNEEIDFHCDLADVVGLLCLSAAKSGGLSRIASSVTAYNAVLKRRPDLIEALYQPFEMDTRGEGGVNHLPVVPCAYAFGALRTFWHSGYFRSVTEHPTAPAPSADQRTLLNLYSEVLNEPGASLEMELRPGDIQLLSNHTIVHGRTSFDDEGGAGRHLLRLWLSLPQPESVRERVLKERSRLGVINRLARARWSQTHRLF